MLQYQTIRDPAKEKMGPSPPERSEERRKNGARTGVTERQLHLLAMVQPPGCQVAINPPLPE